MPAPAAPAGSEPTVTPPVIGSWAPKAANRTNAIELLELTDAVKNASFDVGDTRCFPATTVETPVDRLTRTV